MILENIFFNTSWHLQHIVIDMNKILHAAFLLCALAFLPLSCAFSMCEGSDDESDDDSLPPSAAAGPVKVKEGAAAAPAKEEILAGVPYTINCSSNPGANLEAFPRDGTITLARALRGGSKISNGSSSLWEQGGILRAIPRIVGGGIWKQILTIRNGQPESLFGLPLYGPLKKQRAKIRSGR